MFDLIRIICISVLLFFVENTDVSTEASENEKDWAGTLLIMLFVFFFILFLAKFDVKLCQRGIKGPVLIFLVFGMFGLSEHVLEGFFLNDDLPHKERYNYDSLFIHYTRYLLLGSVILYVLFVIYSFFLLVKVLFYEDPTAFEGVDNNIEVLPQ